MISVSTYEWIIFWGAVTLPKEAYPNFIEADYLGERMDEFIQQGSRFLALPGGLGTIMEILVHIERLKLNSFNSYLPRIQNKVILYDINGDYQNILVPFLRKYLKARGDNKDKINEYLKYIEIAQTPDEVYKKLYQ